MGLTIHYQGQLLSEAAYKSFIAIAKSYGEERKWLVKEVEEAERELTRILQPEDPDAAEVEELYIGSSRGLVLLPHAQCEPLTFVFDHDLFMQDWTKTQFAGSGIHAAIVELFRRTEPLFEMLDVQDEAGFWEGEMTEAELPELFARTRAQIREIASESPGSSVAVVTQSGRIIDIFAAD